jgi:hypothetical protein
LGILLPTVIAMLITGCSYFQETTQAPNYIRIDSIPFRDSLTFTTGRNNGRHNVNITDAWVFADGKFIGCYELPAIIPVAEAGPEVMLTVEPGVFSDGVKDYRISYPFYKSFYQKVQLSPGVVVPIRFGTSYKAESRNLKLPFPYYFDFESATDSSLIVGSNNNFGSSIRTFLPSEIFPDSGKSALKLFAKGGTGNLKLAEFVTLNQVRLPQDNSPIYLELNYKSNKSFLVGLFYKSTSNGSGYIYDLNLLPTNGVWRKIYVSLVDEAISAPSGSNFQLAIRAALKDDGSEYILIDNLRLLQMDR